MDELEKSTRKDKFEKRRKNTKFISILLVVSVILLICLIGIWLFGGDSNNAVDETTEEQTDENNTNEVIEEQVEEEAPEENEMNDEALEEEDTEPSVEEESENDQNNEDIVTEEVEPSDDNVSEAYTGNWEPVSTEQSGPHTVNYDSDSQDRIEMTEAILLATGLKEEDYHEWWVGNGGDQKIIATVSDNAETEVYRVYLSWIDNEGWKPTKVEALKENDWEKYK